MNRPEPVKGYGVVNKKGELYPEMYSSREDAEDNSAPNLGDTIVRVELAVIHE